ncbi:MAG: LytTR family DNA-binding domain-containing protein [Treponema sp.]|nr:LytTR family DNA-binding domain-containing protein [Treponema sp.]
MRIAICEDDKASRDFEIMLIHQWAEKNQLKIIVDSYSSAENFLFESEDKIEYDLLLLDIQMGKMNGFELAKVLRNRGFSGELAFLTGIMDYALDGYEVGAVRYILKPVKEQNLFNVLDLVYEEFRKRAEEVYLLELGSDVTKIPYSEIIYVEARGHYVHLCGCAGGMNGGKFFEKEWKASFGTVSLDFEGHGFFCLRRGLIVNLLHVQKITKSECVLTNGEVLPVARNNYDNLNLAFIEFYKEKSL